MKQYLVFSGHKAIVSAGPPGRDDDDVVAVLTSDAVSARGRSIEAPHLAALSRIPALAAMVPRQLGSFEFGRSRCFVLERIPGVTLDQPLRPLERVTEAAADFLVSLHRETAVPTTVDDSALERLVLPLLNACEERNPDFAGTLKSWPALLRSHLWGRRLCAVFQHGDFKVENVIYQPQALRLMSVIDWEHARRPGLPLLDLLYLLVYNRVIRGDHWTTVLDDVIVGDRWNASERARLDGFMQVVDLDRATVPALRALFLAHHIGCRIHLGVDAGMRAKVDDMLARMTRVLQDPLES
jgi:aminoglycoside phosphotransferase (APT) family kinase protein